MTIVTYPLQRARAGTHPRYDAMYAKMQARLRYQLQQQALQKMRPKVSTKAKTKVKVATKKKIDNTTCKPDTNGNTHSFYKTTLGRFTKFRYNMMKDLPTIVHYQNYGERLTGLYGQQQRAALGPNTLDQTMIQSIISSFSGGENTRLFLKSVHNAYMIRNQSTNGCHLKIYDVVARVANSVSPITAITNGYTEIGSLTGKSVYVGSSPFLSKEFCTYWKVMSVRNTYLGAGQSHRHTRLVNLNKLYNNQLTENSSFVPGISLFTIVEFYGDVINDTADADVTTGINYLDVVSAIQVKYCYNTPTDPVSVFNYSNTLSSTITGAGFVNPEDENIETSITHAG